ncbi:putative powdery mildew resistance protein, RPW8 [Rosa chinensis]|uniref:Putative powdery mildew resistance protein, RPW8 n=1 Tax=Rosa chinensis TaxID=74649 RepID=A0A2P6RNE1_ROSCH|nr:probable disease resistance protein At5g66900 isoform X1 [Rosa chinensis]PRQ47901.1 putative powdery mildew resistance protein, RPW8 [Rosa chinensis]
MVIVGEFVGGAALGAAFGTLFDVVKEALEKSAMFKPLLKTIKSTLDSLQPLIQQIEMHNAELNLPNEEIESCKKQMEEGVELVRKLSKVSKWNYRKPRYTDQLVQLDGSLKRMLDIMKVQEARDVKETLVLVRSIDTVVKRLEGNGLVQSQFEINGCCAVPDEQPPPTITVGLDAPLEELKKNFLKDGVSMLVLAGPGGCGKTTLAKAFCQDQEVKDIFKKNIFFVTVSKTPNLNHIVRELCQLKGFQVPFFNTEVTAVSWLETFLRETVQHPLLLVLDGVWSGSESLLNKFAIKMSNYKILVTSRFAFPRFGSPYYLASLTHEDAMTLFRHSASLGDRSSYIPEDLPRKIVERCKGFPPAITMVGRSLCGQPVEIWQNRLMEWSRGSSILDSESDLLDYLKNNLAFLDKGDMTIVKECFIDLGSFPEDQRIPVAGLIDMWAELYELDEDCMSIANLYELASQGLANLVCTRKDNWEVDRYFSEHFVTQHYMLRELAIHQTSQEPIAQRKRLIIDICGDNLPRWWTEQKFQPVKARLLSISTDGVFSTKWHNMQLPQAEVLVLNFQTKNYALPEFVEKMDKLKVLIVTNYGFLPAELSNFQLLGSSSNLKRIRLERISIPSLINDSVQLKSLQKISLYMCNIGQAFSNCSIQITYAFPNLVEMNIDYCNDLLDLPYNLCDLIHLKKLSITNCHKLYALPEEIGKLVNLQVLRLRSCIHLLELPNSIRSLKMLYFLDISDCYSMKELPEDIGELCSLKKLNMRQCSKLQELPPSVLWLKLLQEVVCDEHTEKLWEPFIPYLRKIHIKVAKQNWHPCSDWTNLVVTRMEKTEVVDNMVESQINTVQADIQAEFKGEIKVARDNLFPTQSQSNLVVTRVEKREVMDKPVKSHIETVKTELQAEFKAEMKALRDEFTNKLDVITDLLVHLIQGKNEKEWEGKDIPEQITSVFGDYESGATKSGFRMHRNSKKVTHQLQKVNQLSPLPSEEQIVRQFSAWISNPNASRCNLEIFDAPKEWFIDLMTSGTWLSDSHVDVFLYAVRKRANLQSQSSSQCCTILDTVFWSWMNGRWEDFQNNSKSYKWDSDLRDYPLGKSPKYARRWSEVDHLYLPININNQHWVAVCADIIRRKLTVYNSMRSATQDEFISNILKPMATMLPSLLVQSGFYEHRPELSPLTSPLKVVHLADNIPQQIVSGDCGVFMLNYIEYLSYGRPLGFVQADIQLFREKMALEMFALTMMGCSQQNRSC